MTTFSTLKSDINAFAIRSDIDTDTAFGAILRMAEADIARKVRTVQQEVSATLTFTGRSQDLPEDFLEVRTPFVNDTTRDIRYLTPNAIRRSPHWTNGRVAAFYTIEGGDQTAGSERAQVTIAGPASASSSLALEINYWKRFAALVDPTDTNWLLTNHYDVYLFACMKNVGLRLQDWELHDRYQMKFDILVEDISVDQNRARFGAVDKSAAGSHPRSIV